jgi:FKBP-type peptidyl-prolyl cis-trans isomerase 2
MQNAKTFDTSKYHEPLEFIIGNRTMILGLEKGAVGIWRADTGQRSEW